MGNHISNGAPAIGKVVLVDGTIQEFDQPLTVAELMLEYPQQVVVELKEAEALGQKKPTPLPADSMLEFDKFYLMVPIRKGKPAQLSPQQAHQILLRVNDVIRSRSLVTSSKYLPFFAKICPASNTGDAYCKLVGEKKERVEEKEREMEECNEVEIVDRPDYLSRTLSGRGWKPSLDTIVEKKNEVRKSSNWVVLASKVGKRIHSKGLVWG